MKIAEEPRRLIKVLIGVLLCGAPAMGGRLIPCSGDADRDLRVDFRDITESLLWWGTGGPGGDADGDGVVNFHDIVATLANWNTDCASALTAGAGPVVARRFLGTDGAPCRLYMAGDSISGDSYGQTNQVGTGFHYGVIRKWTPPNWSGIFMTANGSAGDRYGFAASLQGTLRHGGENLPGIGEGLLPVNSMDLLFHQNASPAGPFQQFYTLHLESRYGVGAWTADRDLIARYIYLKQPNGVPVRICSWRPTFQVVGEASAVNQPSAVTHITYVDVPVPASSVPNAGAGAYGALPDIYEVGFRFVTLGCRLFDPADPGFELAVAGLGGSTPRDHTRAGGPILRYSDESLTQLVDALDSNTFWIMLGANQADESPMFSQLEAGNPALYQQYMRDIVERYHDAAIAAGNTNPRFLLLSTYKIGWGQTNSETRWTALKAIAESRDDTLAIDLYALCGADVSAYLIDAAHMNWQGSDRFASLIWELLSALANRAD